METSSINMIEIRTEGRQGINEDFLQSDCLFIYLFIFKNNVKACPRITIAAL